ncbi:sigma-70 family RNA polymerase sigma factor [Oscillatoria salina IIICB1]|nr:sigma-70 family RNA polymerase sigma factor [Oscillatoria salina IIICB1]NET91090.1 sigma-70 family RNA polymerase sigma factor [Kamptonema sp. SIO1D9]
MDELNKHLRRIAIEAQQYPPRSPARQIAITKLFEAIQTSGKLTRPYWRQFPGLYDEIYNVAKQKLFCYIYERIDNYSPERGEVLQWVNFLFGTRFFVEAIREITLPDSRLSTEMISQRIFYNLDNDLWLNRENEANPSLSEQIIKYLEDDPEGIFQATHMTDNPAANFRYLALQRIAGYKWREIESELGIHQATLCSFYLRCLQKLAPIIKEYLAD